MQIILTREREIILEEIEEPIYWGPKIYEKKMTIPSKVEIIF